MIMTAWSKIEDKIHKPDTKGVEYRENMSTVFADNKLWFFGRKSVEALPNDSMSWHESCLLGGFVSIFDLASKKWEFKEYGKVDDTHSHRDHIFAVKNKVLMIVYGVSENYWKLYGLDNDKWTEIKFDDHCSKKCCPSGCKSPVMEDVEDGLHVACGNCLCKLEITVEGGHVKHAKCSQIGSIDLMDIGPNGSLALLASSKNKMVAWFGMEMCGWWWQPERPLTANVKPGDSDIKFEKNKFDEGAPKPTYHYGGPRHVIVSGDHVIMMGGSQQVGMGRTKDNHEVWSYDMAAKSYKQSAATTPDSAPGYRFNLTFDRDSGNVYMCDVESGIYMANAKSLL